MTGDEIRAAIAAGMTPRELDERLEADHRKQTEAEIAEGKWRCRLCGEPMKLRCGSGTMMFCDRHRDDKR